MTAPVHISPEPDGSWHRFPVKCGRADLREANAGAMQTRGAL